VVLAPTLQQMFVTQWNLQRACEIQIATLSMGKPIMVSDDVVAVHQRDLAQAIPPGGGMGVGDFNAWVRRIDRVDRSWRD
jgi:hypothetical protein